MNQSNRISYFIMAVLLVLIGALHLGTLLLTSLRASFSYTASLGLLSLSPGLKWSQHSKAVFAARAATSGCARLAAA